MTNGDEQKSETTSQLKTLYEIESFSIAVGNLVTCDEKGEAKELKCVERLPAQGDGRHPHEEGPDAVEHQPRRRRDLLLCCGVISSVWYGSIHK